MLESPHKVVLLYLNIYYLKCHLFDNLTKHSDFSFKVSRNISDDHNLTLTCWKGTFLLFSLIICFSFFYFSTKEMLASHIFLLESFNELVKLCLKFAGFFDQQRAITLRGNNIFWLYLTFAYHNGCKKQCQQF